MRSENDLWQVGIILVVVGALFCWPLCMIGAILLVAHVALER